MLCVVHKVDKMLGHMILRKVHFPSVKCSIKCLGMVHFLFGAKKQITRKKKNQAIIEDSFLSAWICSRMLVG